MIQHLKTLFSQFGLPDILVNDNLPVLNFKISCWLMVSSIGSHHHTTHLVMVQLPDQYNCSVTRVIDGGKKFEVMFWLNLVTRVEQKQQQQKQNQDAHAVSCQFQVEEEVYVRDFRPGHTWLQGKIVKCSGSVSYRIKLDNGQVVRRHQDHLRRWSTAALILTDDITVDRSNIEKAPRWNPPRNRRCPSHYTIWS